MKRLTKAQSELIDAFLAEHAARVSTAQLEKDFLISEVFSAFTEPVAVCLHAASRPGPLLSKRVLVLGAGPIGTILALVARSAGAGFVAVGDVIDEPLRRLADLGVDETINVATEADRLARHAEGKGTFDIVFEASGSAGATISALDVVKPGGTIKAHGRRSTCRRS